MRLLLVGEHFTLPALMRDAALGVKFGNPLKAAVREEFGIFVQALSTAALLKHLEVVCSAFAISGAKDTLAALFNEDLTLMGVAFLLTRIVNSLFFWGARQATRRCPRPQPPACAHLATLFDLAMRTRLS